MEDEITKVTTSKQGRCYKVFKMKEVVMGPKSVQQEAQEVKDPSNGDIVVSNSEIKKVTLKYYLDTLKDNEPREEFRDLKKRKGELLKELLDDKDEGSFSVKDEDFWSTIAQFRKKNKQSYDFLVLAGDKFQSAIFKLVKRILDYEEIPQMFFKTTLVQLYKGKGSRLELGHSRFLHMKHWLARICEALVVQGDMSEKIFNSSTMYQIGGQPGQRTQFHLFSVKSIMAIRSKEDRGVVLTVADIRKFFDKESLTDACITL